MAAGLLRGDELAHLRGGHVLVRECSDRRIVLMWLTTDLFAVKEG